MDVDAWPPENADSSDEELPEWGSDEEDDDAFATTAEDEAARSKKARKDDDVPSVQAMAVDGQAYTQGALKTIASELKWMAKSDDATRGWRGGPMGDDVGQWQLDVPAESVPADLPLRGDMARLGCPAITKGPKLRRWHRRCHGDAVAAQRVLLQEGQVLEDHSSGGVVHTWPARQDA